MERDDRKERERLFDLLKRGQKLLSLDVPLETRRASMNKAMLPVPSDIAVTPTDEVGRPAEWIVPSLNNGTVVFYVHGGGFHLGGLADSREFASRIAHATSAAVVNIDYRLAPEAPYPAALEDLTNAYMLLLSRFAARDITILGDSAGAGLALALAMDLRDAKTTLPRCLVLLSPWADLAMDGDSYTSRAHRDPVENAEFLQWCAGAYASGQSLRNPRISPLYGDFHALPPMMVLVGTEEVMFDDAVGIAAKAEQAGVEVSLDIAEGMPHVYPRFAAILSEGQRAVSRIAKFIEEAKGENARAT